MKTYLTVMFSSEGETPSQVTSALMNLGFKPSKGAYDYVYEWQGVQDIRDIIWFADRVHAALKGTNCLFKFETV